MHTSTVLIAEVSLPSMQHTDRAHSLNAMDWAPISVAKMLLYCLYFI